MIRVIIATAISLLFLIFTATTASADTLSAVALFARCYAQVTQLRVPDTDARMVAVKNGTKDPIVACLEVLDLAKFTGNGGTTLGNTADVAAQAVLRTFQSLHYSWFSAKQFVMLELSAPTLTDSTFDVFDPSSPALYYTKALFDPAAQYRDVITSSYNLRPIRSGGKPTTGVYARQPASGYGGGAGNYLVQTGVLLGAADSGVMTISGQDFGKTLGGGFLGTSPYIQLAATGGLEDVPDGAVNIPRTWGRDLFKDVMCRDLPVARVADVSSLVVVGAQAPFRQSAACTKCHASMDRAAFTIRNFRYFNGDLGGQPYSPVGITFVSPSAAAESSWPSSPDSSFGVRPPNGTLFYRAHDGVLINQAVTGVADLGAKVAAQDDFYICAAKRYFAYFTGINVDIGDLNDPDYPKTLSTADMAARQTVIDLGKRLRVSQKTRTLIEEILKLPQYQRSDMGLLTN